jgi:hypothetical protein
LHRIAEYTLQLRNLIILIIGIGLIVFFSHLIVKCIHIRQHSNRIQHVYRSVIAPRQPIIEQQH